MNCGRFQELMSRYLQEELGEEERVAWREHLLGCRECRMAALKRDPSLLFALASKKDGAPEKPAACADSVVAAIRRQRLERRLKQRRRPWLAAAAAAVIALGGGLAFHEMERNGTPSPRVAPVAQALHEAPEVDVENEGENVRVYQLAADENTTVTFVVDPSLEL